MEVEEIAPRTIPWRIVSRDQKLALLSSTSILVNDNGYITDHAGYPMANQPSIVRSYRIAFDEEDNRLLTIWLDKAAAQGISLQGPRFFRDLERVTSSRHTWQSWQRHWRQEFRDRTPNQGTVDDALERQSFLDQVEKSGLLFSNPDACNTPNPHLIIDPGSLSVGPSPTTPRLQSQPSPQAVGPLVPESRPNCSEEALRKLLGLRDQGELVTWLSQGWVVDIYAEYCRATIDDWRAAMEIIQRDGGDIPPPERRSTQKFLVHRAGDALRSRNSRFISTHVTKDYWTRDDHDVRFIVRLVDAGRASMRCWERYNYGDHIGPLCTVAYRLMCWLRAMYRIVVATSGASQWHKANCDRWVTILNKLRRQRLDQGDVSPTVAAVQESTSPLESRNPVTVPVQAQLSYISWDDTFNIYPHSAASLESPAAVTNLRSPPALSSSPFHQTGLEHPLADPLRKMDSSVSINSDTSWHTATEGLRDRVSSVGFITPHCHNDQECVSTASSNEFNHSSTHHGVSVDYDIPHVPKYPPIRSKKGWNQLKAIEWMTEAGKKRFDARQDALLGRWGVSAEHNGTCVLVPASWSDLDPQDLVEDFSYEKCPPSGSDEARLSFAMSDHSVLWARAASWFDSGAWPWTGAAFDNFLGMGPYRPMDGSHLCHHNACINQHHVKYESSGINSNRNRCMYAAQEIRLMQLDIPQHCARHEPPCLLQHAALTPFEAYLIQFSVFRIARGLPSIEAVPRPSDHPYSTFEYQLPLSFANCSVGVDPSNLISESQPVTVPTQVPVLTCRFCTRVATYKRITALWCHIRDKHTNISNQERLEEVIRTGSCWREHYECQPGYAINRNDPTWMKLEQIKDKDFNWDIVLTWKTYCPVKNRIS